MRDGSEIGVRGERVLLSPVAHRPSPVPGPTKYMSLSLDFSAQGSQDRQAFSGDVNPGVTLDSPKFWRQSLKDRVTE